MIHFASDETTFLVRQMWKTCFGDSDEFLDLFFARVYKAENTLIYFEEGEAVASLQMLPYSITFCGCETPFYYLSGLCTLPEHRKKGYMAHLIQRAHEIMIERKIPLSILIPAEGWLFDFYNKYDYEQVFERDELPIISLGKLIAKRPKIHEAYLEFDREFRSKDFCVQKTLSDFETIVTDAQMDNFPQKTNLSAMAYVVNIEYLLTLYAHINPQTSFVVCVEDILYKVDEKSCFVIESGSIDFDMDRRQLCRMLFGFKTSELSEEYHLFFPEQKPTINFMLE